MKSKKAGEINKQLGLHSSFLHKISIFILAPAADMLGTGQVSIGCM